MEQKPAKHPAVALILLTAATLSSTAGMNFNLDILRTAARPPHRARGHPPRFQTGSLY